MNPNTMTLDECRDWLAVATGYWLEACDCDTCTIVGNGMLQCLRKAGDGIRYHAHPYPPTLAVRNVRKRTPSGKAAKERP